MTIIIGNEEDQSNGGGNDGYGITFMERLSNLPKAIMNGDVLSGSNNPNVVKVGFSGAQTFFLPTAGAAAVVTGLTKVPKAWFGFKVGLGGSKNTLLSSAIYSKLGIKGSLNRQLWTPFGKASNIETFFGRWTAPAGGGVLLYDWWNNSEDK